MTASKALFAQKSVATKLALVVFAVFIQAVLLNLNVLAADEVVYQGTVTELSRDEIPFILGGGYAFGIRLAEHPDKLFQMPENLAIPEGESPLKGVKGNKVKIYSGPPSGLMITDARTKQSRQIYSVTKVERIK
jgi:hypothetical protein